MFYVDQFVYTNKLRAIHPLEKLLFSVATIVICQAANQVAVSLAIIALMVGLLLVKAKIASGVLLKLFTIPLGFLLVGVTTIAAVISGQNEGMIQAIRIGSFYIGVSAASLTSAMKTGVISLSTLSCLYFLALTTPITEIVYALRLLKLPSILVELMTLIYRFIFLFLETTLQIYTAQSSRWGYSSFRRSLHSLGVLLANVWGRAFFKTQALYTGLLSRGYDEDLRFLSPRQQYSYKWIGFFAITDLVLLTVALI